MYWIETHACTYEGTSHQLDDLVRQGDRAFRMDIVRDLSDLIHCRDG